MSSNFHHIRKNLLQWYSLYKRSLPWRETRDPYLIWLSEIILQQTRVDQGLDYYRRIALRYPNVRSLSKAREDELMKLWQGLGYYSRARNLLKSAIIIEREMAGVFPHSYTELLNLPGIGPYTAAAIASIAFDEAVPAIDGNVIRVISRLFGVQQAADSAAGKTEFRSLMTSLMDIHHPGEFNQAMMEMGALQCIPVRPDCETCPVNDFCFAFKHKLVSDLPVKKKRVKQKVRFFNYLVIETSGGFWLRKRNEKDIWQGLYEFPLVETEKAVNRKKLTALARTQGIMIQEETALLPCEGQITHLLTHQQIKACFWIHTSSVALRHMPEGYLCIPAHKLYKYAVPVLVSRFMEHHFARLGINKPEKD